MAGNLTNKASMETASIVNEMLSAQEGRTCIDFHISRFVQGIRQDEWLPTAFRMHDAIRSYAEKAHPQWNVMLLIELVPVERSRKRRIPQTLSRRNFKSKRVTPPSIILYRGDAGDVIPPESIRLPRLGKKYAMNACYVEEVDDVVYRKLYFY